MLSIYLNIFGRRAKSSLIFALLLSAALFPLRLAAEEIPDSLDLPALRELPPGFMDSSLTDSIPGSEAHKSPSGALLRALALPGWGQFYTGHPVRGSLAAVLESGFFTAMLVKYRDRNDLRDRLHARERELGPGGPLNDPERVELNARIRNLNLKAGDYMAYGLTTLVLSLVDSYVSAHLYHFDRNFYPAADSRGVSLRLEF